MGPLTACDAIKSYLDGKKTPYQLDLEVKDRKPNIVPKVGDRVKIKSREWYEKWKDEDDDVMFVHLPKFFSKGMSKYCGLTMTIKEELRHGFRFENCEDGWNWLPEFFEEVYPVQEQLVSKFPKIDFSCAIQPLPNCLGGGMVLSNEEQERLEEQFLSSCSEREKVLLKKQPLFASKVEDVTKRLAAYSLVQGLDAKPKLKQVKTTHLIKLKKL